MNTDALRAGVLERTDRTDDLAARPWHPHPRFAGVSLKHLVTAQDTGGAMSAHLVRIEAGACLDSHVHEASLELHEVLTGTGRLCLAGREAEYAPGVFALIPAGAAHSVRAHDGPEGQGLFLLATFAPALL